MKPQPPFANVPERRFPLVDFCFQANRGEWRGSWPGGDEDSPAQRFNRFNSEFLAESMRERQREMIVFGFMMLVTAWPVFYMLHCVARLLVLRHSPIF